MNILQVNNYHYPRGGSDRYFLNVARGLSEKGHHVQTFAPEGPFDVDLDLKSELKPEGLDPEIIPAPFDVKKFFYNPLNRRVLHSLIQETKINVAHLHIYYGRLTPSILRPLKQFGVPIVQTLHDYKVVCIAQSMMKNGHDCDACKKQRYVYGLLNRCNRQSITRSAASVFEAYTSDLLGGLRAVDKFLAVSVFQKEKLIHMGMDPQKIKVLYNFSKINLPPSNHPGNYWLFVGRIVKGKGIETLLQSYAHYRSQSKRKDILPLHIVGDGPLLQHYIDLTARLGLSSSVYWRGSLYGIELEQCYRECRALINPSEFNETFGLTNLEAMSHGRAVICSDRGAFPEVVRHGKDGYVLVDPDPINYAKHMARLTPCLATRFGRNGHERAMNKFSQSAHLHDLEDIYNEVIEQRSIWQHKK